MMDTSFEHYHIIFKLYYDFKQCHLSNVSFNKTTHTLTCQIIMVVVKHTSFQHQKNIATLIEMDRVYAWQKRYCN